MRNKNQAITGLYLALRIKLFKGGNGCRPVVPE